MPFPLFRRTPHSTICALYGAIVAQARRPAFYRIYGVADSVTGRFELIVLHTALLLRRMADEPALHALGQGIFDEFCRDMDHNLREMGVGDTGVPRQMKRIGEAFFGRRNAYLAVLTPGQEDGLPEVLRRNLYEGDAAAPAPRMAQYVRAAVLDLLSQETLAISQGKLSFPEPESIRE
jgi:cytochrome b pre-mRNA-processing protein 3